ncbi:MAG: hypothetical protein J2P17_06405 [Mycobacterium sp.]|nr:hypothetical protein [Mycobacterium sp.]
MVDFSFPFDLVQFETDDLFSCRLVLTGEEMWDGKLAEFTASLVWEGVLSGKTWTPVDVGRDLPDWSSALEALESGSAEVSWRPGTRVAGLIFRRENPFSPGFSETAGWYVNVDDHEGRYARILVGLYFEPDQDWFAEMRRRLDVVMKYVAAHGS